MSARAFAAPSEAVAYLCWCLGWDGGWMPVYINGSQRPYTWLEARSSYRRLPEQAERLDRLDNAQVEVGLPEAHRNNGGPAQSTVLWTWLETKAAAAWAGRFKPMPAVVLKIGGSCRRLCLWPLDEVVPFVILESSNRRLAYALHSPQKYATPERLRIPLPGTFIRAGRSVPAPVLATRLELETFERERVVGRLKEPPAPYMQRLREGRIPGRQ